MVLGKFLPPHKGHQYLIDFAANFVEELTVVVGTLKSEPISGELRYQWLRDMYPKLNIVHLTDENPQKPSEHKYFWNIWRTSLLKVLPYKPDYVFASEDYGYRLAQELGAKFISVNKSRDIIQISGTKIREKPFKYWDYLPDPVKNYFLKRIYILGSESTEKSTLTQNLAKHYQTNFVPKYFKTYLEGKKGVLTKEDISFIAQGQIASEKALLKNANKIFFSDRDLLKTSIWDDFLYQSCEPWIKELSYQNNYDLYLLTDIENSYIHQEQDSFMQQCIEELEKRNLPYVRLSGSWDDHFIQACNSINKLIENL